MFAEALREAAVLVAVFAPLEELVTGGPAALTWGEVGVIVAIAGGLIVAGISMEVYANEPGSYSNFGVS